MPKFNYYELSLCERNALLKALAGQEISLLIKINFLSCFIPLGILVILMIFPLHSFLWVFLFTFVLFLIGCLLVLDIRYLKIWYDIECGHYKYYYASIEKYIPNKNCYKVTFFIDGKLHESFTKINNGKKIHVFIYKNKIFSKVEME